jgi:hypothetical protein
MWKITTRGFTLHNSVSPGAVMTGRRRAFFEKWAPAHNLTVEEAIQKFPEHWDHSLRKTGRSCRPHWLYRIARGEVDDRSCRTYGWRRDQGHLAQNSWRNDGASHLSWRPDRTTAARWLE